MSTTKSLSMLLMLTLAFMLLAAPAAGQVGGFGGFGTASGSMLNVGSPNTAGAERFSIYPWLAVSGNYATSVQPQAGGGDLTNSFYGGVAGYGLGGRKAWYRTSLGISFAGMYRPKIGGAPRSFSAHTLALGVSHLAGPRTRVSAGVTSGYSNGGMGIGAGMVGGGMALPFGTGAFMQAGQVDFGNPNDNGIVDNEFFDVGVLFGGATVGIVHQLGQRWNVGAGGGTFLTRRRYRGLQEMQGFSGYAMASYSIDRSSSLGVQYAEQHFSHRGLFGNNRVQSTSVFYRRQLTPTVSTGVSVGGFLFSSRFIGRVAVDPALQELLGGFTSFEVQDARMTGVMGNAFISKRFQIGSLSANYFRGVTPGNGVLLASRRDQVSLVFGSALPGGFSAGLMTAYGRSSGMQQIGLVATNWMASGSIGRHLGAGFSTGFSAGYREFSLTGGLPVKSRFFNVGLTWTPSDAVLVF
jgi:hypothetical protein